MTKTHEKLLVLLGAIICSLCLVFGITACGGAGEHTHTFGGFWLFDGEDGHYRFATCHPEVKSGLELHADEDADNKCDVCGYLMHAHVDEDEDNICDDCQSEIHRHEFEEEWHFNENKHWHEATCEHFIERSSYLNHTFTQGVCECGITESEVKVYDLYKNSLKYDLYFIQWLEWLNDNGVISVEYTDSGDGVYHYEDGHSEVRFLGERTVKVKAESNGEPLADVWFMVSMFYDGKYYEANGSIALGIAKTDSTGIAEITFRPIGGYTSAGIQYRIRVALAADVALAQGISEENAKPVPNRYVASKTTEFFPYVVDENSSEEDIAATVNFTLSNGWNSYNTIKLPYKRYYQDLINGENIKEEGLNYAFTTSGDNLFDYFIFEPAKYSFRSSRSIEDSAKIEENAKQAASGIYRIYFTCEGNANATLYYWNENGVNIGAFHKTKSDGTPSDDYITSVSGGTAGDGEHTGGNFVDVTVIPANGLRQYQFGIVSDSAVKVNITVERVGDYVIRENLPITLGDNDGIALYGNGTITKLILSEVPADNYFLTVTTADDDKNTRKSGIFSAYVDVNAIVPLWDGISKIKGIINIPEGAECIYIINNYGTEENTLTVSVNLTVYTPPVVEADDEISVPISGTLDVPRTIGLGESVTSGMYKMSLTLPGGQALNGISFYVRVVVGDRNYSISLPMYAGESQLVTAYITVNAGDELSLYVLRINGDRPYSQYNVNGKLKLTLLSAVEQDQANSVELGGDNATFKGYVFVAFKAGTYRLSVTQINQPEYFSDYFGYADLTSLGITELITKNTIKNGVFSGPQNEQDFVTEDFITFTVEEGEILVLNFSSNRPSAVHLNFNFTIEYVEE